MCFWPSESELPLIGLAVFPQHVFEIICLQGAPERRWTRLAGEDTRRFFDGAGDGSLDSFSGRFVDGEEDL